MTQLERGTFIATDRMILETYLNQWLSNVRNEVGSKTWSRYCSIIKLHVIPALGHAQLHHLRPLHVEEAKTFWM